MVGLLVVCLIIPLSFLSAVIAQQLPGGHFPVAPDLIRSMQAPEWLKDIPMVGPWLYNQIAIVFEPEALNELIRKLIDPISREVLTVALSLGNGLIQMGFGRLHCLLLLSRWWTRWPNEARNCLTGVSGGLSDETIFDFRSTPLEALSGVLLEPPRVRVLSLASVF